MNCYKCRKEIAAALRISDSTLYRDMQFLGLDVPSGRISPIDQKMIFDALGISPKEQHRIFEEWGYSPVETHSKREQKDVAGGMER